MEKQFTLIGLDAQYGTRGLIFTTEDERYKIVDIETLDTLLKQIDSFKKSQEEAYFRGSNVSFNSDKLSGAVSAITCNNVETGEVIVSKRAIEDILQSNNTENINNSVILNLNNQISFLKEENKKLKNVVIKDQQKQIDTYAPKLKEANSQNKKLREELEHKDREISRLKSISTEVENLHAKVADLQKQLEELRSSATNRMSKAREVKMKKRDQTASMIISLAVQRYDIETIRQILYTDYSKDVKPATVYRAISVREDSDRERVLNLYAEYPSEFKGVSKQELIHWFETNRIKKLHLVSKEDFISKFGEIALPERDPYITEDYFSTKDI